MNFLKTLTELMQNLFIKIFYTIDRFFKSLVIFHSTDIEIQLKPKRPFPLLHLHLRLESYQEFPVRRRTEPPHLGRRNRGRPQRRTLPPPLPPPQASQRNLPWSFRTCLPLATIRLPRNVWMKAASISTTGKKPPNVSLMLFHALFVVVSWRYRDWRASTQFRTR